MEFQAASRPASAGEDRLRFVRWRHEWRQLYSTRRCCLGLERENPFRTAGKMDKPLRCRPLEGRRDQKSPLRRCFKLRPPWRFGVRRFCLRLLVCVGEQSPCGDWEA